MAEKIIASAQETLLGLYQQAAPLLNTTALQGLAQKAAQSITKGDVDVYGIITNKTFLQNVYLLVVLHVATAIVAKQRQRKSFSPIYVALVTVASVFFAPMIVTFFLGQKPLFLQNDTQVLRSLIVAFIAPFGLAWVYQLFPVQIVAQLLLAAASANTIAGTFAQASSAYGTITAGLVVAALDSLIRTFPIQIEGFLVDGSAIKTTPFKTHITAVLLYGYLFTTTGNQKNSQIAIFFFIALGYLAAAIYAPVNWWYPLDLFFGLFSYKTDKTKTAQNPHAQKSNQGQQAQGQKDNQGQQQNQKKNQQQQHHQGQKQKQGQGKK